MTGGACGINVVDYGPPLSLTFYDFWDRHSFLSPWIQGALDSEKSRATLFGSLILKWSSLISIIRRLSKKL